MSASLVGSEMCIRDSRRRGRLQAPRSQPRSRRRRSRPRGPGAMAGSAPCAKRTTTTCSAGGAGCVATPGTAGGPSATL
eukprot:3396268-Alexandrium_andersonii.AAC.1